VGANRSSLISAPLNVNNNNNISQKFVSMILTSELIMELLALDGLEDLLYIGYNYVGIIFLDMYVCSM
jgi:hypothetical protein